MARAVHDLVPSDYSFRRAELETLVEQWTAEAKKLLEARDEDAALALYRRAADELPGAPWLQHRTAELARRLNQRQAAIQYYRRAATAFQIAEFPRRAIAPLRLAWSVAVECLPQSSAQLVELGTELLQLQKRLGFAADAVVTFERTSAALRAHGFSELPPSVLSAVSTTPPASSRVATSALASGVTPVPPSSRRHVKDGAAVLRSSSVPAPPAPKYRGAK
jgi:tetratricopeptide (TPR) repeat protein